MVRGPHWAAEAPFLCRRCGSPRVVGFGAQIVCSRCGAVMQPEAGERRLPDGPLPDGPPAAGQPRPAASDSPRAG